MADPIDKKILAQLEANEKATQNLEKAISKLSKNSGSSSSSSSLSSSDISSARNSARAISDNINGAFKTGLTRFIEDAVLKYGGLVDYGSSTIENRASVTIKRQAESLTKLALSTEKFIGDKSIQMVFGSAEAARSELQQIYEANTYYLNKMSKDYKDSETAGVEAMANAMLVQRALRINVDDFQKIMSIQMSSSKKMTSEVFEDIAFYADQYADRTSASVYQITNQLTKAMADFDTFGGVGIENLSKMAGYLGELRMDTEAVSGLINKLQGFQGSVSIVSDLAGAFGAIVDPYELMQNALTDPAEALNLIRESILETGMTSEEYGPKLKIMADMLGFSVDNLRRFLNSEIDANSVLENSVKATEKAADSADKAVSKYSQSIVDNRATADIIADMVETQSEVMFSDAFKKITDFKTLLSQFITAKGDLLTELKFSPEDISSFTKNLDVYTSSLDESAREKAKDELGKHFQNILSSDVISDSAKKEAKDLQKRLGEISDASLSEFSDFIKKQKSIQYDLNVDTDGMLAAYDLVSDSDEVKKFIEVNNRPYEYIIPKEGGRSQLTIDYESSIQQINSSPAFQELAKTVEQITGQKTLDISVTDNTIKGLNTIKSANIQINNTNNNEELVAIVNELVKILSEKQFTATVQNNNTIEVKLDSETISKSVDEKTESKILDFFSSLGRGG